MDDVERRKFFPERDAELAERTPEEGCSKGLVGEKNCAGVAQIKLGA
jgi:hypothetical protein